MMQIEMLREFLTELGLKEITRALGYRLQEFQGATAYFVKTDELIAGLKKAHEENHLKKMKKYLCPKVLLIDEIGYHPLDKLSVSLFFNIISER